MTVRYVGDGKYTALAADAKPTNATINSELWETDTTKLYRYNGTVWRPEYIKNPASMLVFKDGSTYYAQEADGTIISSSTTDASTVINAPVANIPGGVTRGFGGRVFIQAGIYDCKTTINMDYTVFGYQGVELQGEGFATQLRFTPASALADGIRIKMTRPRIANIMLYGNSNVTNLLHSVGALPGRSDGGIVEGVYFYGANSDLAGPDVEAPSVISGQIGFLKDGTTATGACFMWNMANLQFYNLDIGAYSKKELATTGAWTNIHCIFCSVGLIFSSGENRVTNVYGTGGHIGRYLIWLKDDGGSNTGSNNSLFNIVGELYAPGQECATLLIDANCGFNRYGQISSNLWGAPFDAGNHFRVIERAPYRMVNRDLDLAAPPPIGNLTNIAVGKWICGYQPIGNAEGILNGCLEYAGITPVFYAAGIDGPMRFLQTPSTPANSVAYYKYNNPNANLIRRDYNPELKTRLLPSQTTTVRYFIGFWDAPTVTPTSTTDFLNGRKGFGFWVDSGVSSGQWKVMTNNGTGASTLTPIAGNPVLSSGYIQKFRLQIFEHTLNAFGAPPPPTVKVVAELWDSVGLIRTIVTTDVPPNNGDILTPIIFIEQLATGGHSGIFFEMELRTGF